jgi:AcrR family transcriptional regulator
VIEAADRLFAERGYSAVVLRDIAQKVGIRHASLYYHFPQGKEELFVEVTAQRMRNYAKGLRQAIQASNEGDKESEKSVSWLTQLRAAANWMLEQPSMHFGRMMQSDMPAISEAAAEQLRIIIYSSLMQPLEAIFQEALENDSVRRERSATYAGMFLSLIEGIDNLPTHYVQGPKHELVDVMLDVFVHGLTN